MGATHKAAPAKKNYMHIEPEFEGYTLAGEFRKNTVQNTIVEEHRLEKLEEITLQEQKHGERI